MPHGRRQNQLMNDNETSHPYYWAGFAVNIGDGAQKPLLLTPRPTATAHCMRRSFDRTKARRA